MKSNPMKGRQIQPRNSSYPLIWKMVVGYQGVEGLQSGVGSHSSDKMLIEFKSMDKYINKNII